MLDPRGIRCKREMMDFRGIEKDNIEIDAVYVGVYNSPILLTEFKRIRWNFLEPVPGFHLNLNSHLSILSKSFCHRIPLG